LLNDWVSNLFYLFYIFDNKKCNLVSYIIKPLFIAMKNIFICLSLLLLSLVEAQAQVSPASQNGSDEYEYAVLYFVPALRGSDHDSLRILYDDGRIENLMRYHMYSGQINYYKNFIAGFKYLEAGGYQFLTNMSPNEYMFRRRKQK